MSRKSMAAILVLLTLAACKPASQAPVEPVVAKPVQAEAQQEQRKCTEEPRPGEEDKRPACDGTSPRPPQARAYVAEGGLDDFHGTGTICDLSKPFTISGGGNTVTFTPSSEQGGSYSYQGSMSGFGVHGSGTYTASTDASGGKITASGNGCVDTPMGTRCNGGTELYTLTPTDPCD